MLWMYFILILGKVISLEIADDNYGMCPDIPTMLNFDHSQYVGRWYLFQLFHTNQREKRRCDVVDYSPNSSNSLNYRATDATRVLTGYLEHKFYNLPRSKLTIVTPSMSSYLPYWVIYTDYRTYSVVTGCVDRDREKSAKWIMILTRRRYPFSMVTNVARRIVRNSGVHGKFYSTTVQHTRC